MSNSIPFDAFLTFAGAFVSENKSDDSAEAAELTLSKEQNYRHAIRVSEKDLASLHELLDRAAFGPVRIRARCADGSQLLPANLKQLLGFENPSFREVIYVGIGAGSEEGPHVTVHLGGGQSGPQTAGFEYVGLKLHDAMMLESEIGLRIKQMKAGYAWLQSLRPPVWILGAFMLFAGLAGLFALIFPNDYDRVDQAMKNTRQAYVLAIIFGSIGLAFAVEWIVDKLCPLAVFEIGRGKQRDDRLSYWREFVFKSVLATLLIGLIGKYLYSFIGPA